MRQRALSALILVMLLALVYLVGSRTRDPHAMPPRAHEPEHADAGGLAETPGEADASASASAAAPASPSASTAALAPGAEADARAPALDRPLRVASDAWELVASALVANGGRATAAGSAFRAAGIDAQIDVVATARDVENRLARGGGDAEGADLAVLPLPEFVAAYERLRVLEPQVVHVVGWSRGREVLMGAREGALAKPAAPGAEATLASDDVPATALALFALDESGVAPGRVHTVTDAKTATFAALARPLPGDRPAEAPAKILLTTADAAHLVPLVAVAARAFVDAHADAIAALGRAWLAGAGEMHRDVPTAARRIAGEPGAPEPAALLERLGWVQDVDPAEEARALGLAGHDAVTIATLFARDWRLLRDAGTLTSPAPDAPPVATAPMARVLPAEGAAASAAADTTSPAPPSPTAARVLLAHRVDRPDTDSVSAEVAWLAGVFPRSVVRVTTRPAALARDAVAAAHDKLGVASERVVAAPGAPVDGSAALVEVLAAP